MQNRHDQSHWEKIGKNYSLFWGSKAKQELHKKELGFINKYLNKTKCYHVFDIGIGSGRIIENYLANPKVKNIYGTDWAGSMVSFCASKFKSDAKVRRIAVHNISRGPLPFERRFDFVSAIRVLKYNKNWKEIIGRIINSLSSNGIFVFTIPNQNSFLRFTQPETSIYRATKQEVEKAIERQGGEMIEITSFMKLPDVLYDFSNNKLYVKSLLWCEKILNKLLGNIFLGRIFFVAIKRVNQKY